MRRGWQGRAASPGTRTAACNAALRPRSNMRSERTEAPLTAGADRNPAYPEPLIVTLLSEGRATTCAQRGPNLQSA
eukprot:3548627-Alexandrium_andersonii.AAC.1